MIKSDRDLIEHACGWVISGGAVNCDEAVSIISGLVAAIERLSDRDAPSDEHSAPRLQGRMANAGDGGETAATRCRPPPSTPDEIDLTPPAELVAKRREIESRRPKVPA